MCENSKDLFYGEFEEYLPASCAPQLPVVGKKNEGGKLSSEEKKKKAARVDELVQQIIRSAEERRILEERLQQFQRSAESIKELYENEKKLRLDYFKKHADAEQKFANVDHELALKNLELEQMRAQCAQAKGPIEYNSLVGRFVKMSQILSEMSLLNRFDQTLLTQLQTYCQNRGIKVSQSPRKNNKKLKAATANENTTAEKETQCDMTRISSIGKVDACTQYISTVSTRGTNTVDSIQKRDVGVMFPAPTDFPAMEVILNELLQYDLSKIRPISPLKELKKMPSIQTRSIGTCTDLCNVQRQIDFVVETTVAPAQHSVNQIDNKDTGKTNSFDPAMFNKLWNTFGCMVFALISNEQQNPNIEFDEKFSSTVGFSKTALNAWLNDACGITSLQSTTNENHSGNNSAFNHENARQQECRTIAQENDSWYMEKCNKNDCSTNSFTFPFEHENSILQQECRNTQENVNDNNNLKRRNAWELQEINNNNSSGHSSVNLSFDHGQLYGNAQGNLSVKNNLFKNSWHTSKTNVNDCSSNSSLNSQINDEYNQQQKCSTTEQNHNWNMESSKKAGFTAAMSQDCSSNKNGYSSNSSTNFLCDYENVKSAVCNENVQVDVNDNDYLLRIPCHLEKETTPDCANLLLNRISLKESKKQLNNSNKNVILNNSVVILPLDKGNSMEIEFNNKETSYETNNGILHNEVKHAELEVSTITQVNPEVSTITQVNPEVSTITQVNPEVSTITQVNPENEIYSQNLAREENAADCDVNSSNEMENLEKKFTEIKAEPSQKLIAKRLKHLTRCKDAISPKKVTTKNQIEPYKADNCDVVCKTNKRSLTLNENTEAKKAKVCFTQNEIIEDNEQNKEADTEKTICEEDEEDADNSLIIDENYVDAEESTKNMEIDENSCFNQNETLIEDNMEIKYSIQSPIRETEEEVLHVPIEIPLNLNYAGKVGKFLNKQRRKDSLMFHLVRKFSKETHKMVCPIKNTKLLSKYKNNLSAYMNCSNMPTAIDITTKLFNPKELNGYFNYKLMAKAIVQYVSDMTALEQNLQNKNVEERFTNFISILYTKHPAFKISLCTELESIIFQQAKQDKLDVQQLLNLTQLYLIIAQLNNTQNSARLFIAKCLYYYKAKASPMIYMVLCAHPTALPHREDSQQDASDPLVNVLKHILMSTKYDMDNLDLRHRELLSKLRFEYHFEPFEPNRNTVLNLLINHLQNGNLDNKVSYAFALFCKRLGQKTVLKDVIQEKLIPLANMWREDSENSHRLATLMDCWSSILKPLSLEMDVGVYLSLFQQFLNATNKSVQESAVCAILRLQRFGVVNCFNSLLTLQYQNADFQPNTLAMLRTFIHRKPLNFWRNVCPEAFDM